MRAPLDHGTVGAEEVAPPHWLQSRSDGHMSLWCDSSYSLFFFDIDMATWTTALIDHLPQELVDVFLGHPVHGAHLQPNLRHKWAMQSEMWNAMFSNVFAMFLHLNNPAGKSLPDGETCTAVHPLFALNKTTMIWSRCSSSSSSQSRS